MIEEALYHQALTKWGLDRQVQMAIEEMSELITVLCKANRQINPANRDEILDEIADAQIMIEQMRIAFGSADVETIKQRKLQRLRHYLEME